MHRPGPNLVVNGRFGREDQGSSVRHLLPKGSPHVPALQLHASAVAGGVLDQL
jgi:hypothetical protein